MDGKEVSELTRQELEKRYVMLAERHSDLMKEHQRLKAENDGLKAGRPMRELVS